MKLAPLSKKFQDVQDWIDFYSKEDQNTAINFWLTEALESFKKFSIQYTEYFENEVIRPNSFNKSETTREHLTENTLQALDDYWLTLCQISEQWSIAHYRQILLGLHEKAKSFMEQAGLKETPFFIYFDKVARARYFPYTRAAFIGVPYRTINDDNRLSAIAHEIGHYLYWHQGDLTDARQTQKRIETDVVMKPIGDVVAPNSDHKTNPTLLQRIMSFLGIKSNLDYEKESATLPKLILPWLEEIYADVVGAYLSEKNFAMSLGTIVQSTAGKKEDILQNDGRHPPLCLRHLVCRRILILRDISDDANFWDEIFSKLGIRQVNQLMLAIPDPSKKVEGPMSANLPPDFPTIDIPISEIAKVLELITSEIYRQVDQAFQKPTAYPAKDPTFDDLLIFARNDTNWEGENRKKAVYERLLSPRILEGGQQHSHGAYAHWTWHEIGTHNH